MMERLRELPIFKPSRRLGQHFLIDDSARKRLLDIAAIKPSDVVLEIGAGTGILTEEIADRARMVIAVEKDLKLGEFLKKKFLGYRSVQVLIGDALKLILPRFDRVVSTPPYYISSKLVLFLMKAKYDLAALTFQEEFARRLIAPSGSPNYGRLSVMAQHSLNIEMHDKIPRQCFYPKPRVDSVIVTISRKAFAVDSRSEIVFADLVRELFSQRRKLLRKALRHYIARQCGGKVQIMVEKLPILDKRVYQLQVEEFEYLSKILTWPPNMI
jgi:16S rRNA (adenine1518-N6/adenine1519-N6)-dimethyltransferase